MTKICKRERIISSTPNQFLGQNGSFLGQTVSMFKYAEFLFNFSSRLSSLQYPHQRTKMLSVLASHSSQKMSCLWWLWSEISLILLNFIVVTNECNNIFFRQWRILRGTFECWKVKQILYARRNWNVWKTSNMCVVLHSSYSSTQHWNSVIIFSK